MRFGSSPWLVPLGWPENKFCTHTCWSSRAVVRIQSESCIGILPCLESRSCVLQNWNGLNLKHVQIWKLPMGASWTSKGLCRCTTVPTKSFISSAPLSTCSDFVKNLELYSKDSQKDICQVRPTSVHHWQPIDFRSKFHIHRLIAAVAIVLRQAQTCHTSRIHHPLREIAPKYLHMKMACSQVHLNQGSI